MNDNEIDRIAAAAHQLRPDWPTTSLRTLIAKNLADRPRRDVAVALAWIACESNTATPARVLEAGPWWKAAAVEGRAQRREPFDPAGFCDLCGLPTDRHRVSDHEFVSVIAHTRRLNDDQRDPDKHTAAALKQLMACEEPRPPVERPKPPANPHVDQLRQLAGTQPEENTP